MVIPVAVSLSHTHTRAYTYTYLDRRELSTHESSFISVARFTNHIVCKQLYRKQCFNISSEQTKSGCSLENKSHVQTKHLFDFVIFLFTFLNFSFFLPLCVCVRKRSVRQMAEQDVLRFVKLFMPTLNYSGLKLLTLTKVNC